MTLWHRTSFWLLTLFSAQAIFGDIYLHNPRGSNNRCDERTNDRLNANRLFDSQNNAAGGYAVPCQDTDLACFDMNYYTGSYLDVRFTTQHACGIQNQCEIIIQYGCDTYMRNGEPLNALGNTCTRTLPDINNNETLLLDQSYGYHETYETYQACKLRPRNTNLYTAEQLLRGGSAIYTRQNPTGQRYGFECPEERDYYPYWDANATRLWRDIAIMTSNISMCPYFVNHSNNPNLTCTNINNTAVNRLGVTYAGASESSFRWQLPAQPAEHCVLRLRYNISLPSELAWFADKTSNAEHRTDPVIYVNGRAVRLALSTDQLPRTFEDRSYTFNILPRPPPVSRTDTIHNINVQGKRGNIAQVRNCFEYDFVPNNLTVYDTDYLHFQWVGSDFNPLNNDGEGRAGTDRSNLVEISDFVGYHRVTNQSFIPADLIDTFTFLSQATAQCFTEEELFLQLQIKNTQSPRNCALLNNASVYFNSRLFKLNATNRTHYYMSTRNNNFSNRNQKGVIIVIHTATQVVPPMTTPMTTPTFAPEQAADTQQPPLALGYIMLIMFCCIFFVLGAFYTYRNHTKMKNFVVRSLSDKV